MSESVKQLVDAIAAGNALETEKAFASAMAEKLSVKLDDMRTQVAQNMFKTEQEAVVEEETETTVQEVVEILGEEEITLAEDEIQLTEEEETELLEKYMGFEKLKAAVAAKGAKDPAAVAAAIGRKKYGKEKFQAAAAAGKKMG